MSLPTTNTSRVVVLQPGECIVIPSDATVTSIIVDGSATYQSECASLPTPTSYVCGSFFTNIDKDSNQDHPLNEENTVIESIIIGNLIIPINKNIVCGGTIPGSPLFASPSELNSVISPSNQAVFKFTGLRLTDDDKRSRVNYYFRIPSDLFSKVEMKVISHTGDNDGNGFVMYLKPVAIDCNESEVTTVNPNVCP